MKKICRIKNKCKNDDMHLMFCVGVLCHSDMEFTFLMANRQYKFGTLADDNDL